jgi:hypothetical protein
MAKGQIAPPAFMMAKNSTFKNAASQTVSGVGVTAFARLIVRGGIYLPCEMEKWQEAEHIQRNMLCFVVLVV